MDIYITVQEAADLEERSYNALVMMLRRNPEKYKVHNEKSDDGGHPRTLIALESLSTKAQKAYLEKQKQEARPLIEGKCPVEEIPWYVDTDLDWYIENYKTAYYKAVELGNIVRDFLSYSDKHRAAYAEAFAQERLGKGQRTLYRYVKAYNKASGWINRLGNEDGKNYDYLKVLALCRKPKETGQFPSIPPEMKQLIKNIWFDKNFASNQGTREMLYEKMQEVAQVNGWEKLPSYQSVSRYINYLMEDEGLRNAHHMASYGIRNYKNKVMVKASRDTASLQVMQLVMGDEHTFDCWVAYKDPSNGKITAIKPTLAGWIDVRSRYILGDILCKKANSDILKQSLLKMLYQEGGGVPEYVYIDNGKDYTAKTMTGRHRNDRSGSDLAFDDETKGFYKSIGIKDDHRALPYEAWSKGQIERSFKTVCDKFTRWMSSYTGTLTGSRTAAKVEKDIKGMLEADKLLTMDEFYMLWNQWLHEKYHQRKHSGLKKAGEKYKTPYALFYNGERYEKAAPPKSYATMLMMRSQSVLVRNIGIVRWGYEYRADELCDYIGQHVDIKYDPSDIATIYVFDKSGKRICEAYSQELLLIAPKVSQKALEEHLRMQKRQIKRDQERLKEAQRPFEELNEGYIGFSTVGGINLMADEAVIKNREKKIVALPDDKTYRQNATVRKKAAGNDYMKSQGIKALEELRNIE